MSEISLRQELRDKRISLLISSKIIAKALNVSITSVTAWERGETDLCAIPNFGELYRQYLQDCEDGKIKYKRDSRVGAHAKSEEAQIRISLPETSLCAKLRAKRVKMMIPLSEASKALHVSASTISYWERGRNVVSMPNFGEIYRQYLQDCEDGKIKYKTNLQTGKTVSLQQFSPGQSTQAIPPNSENSDESNNTDMLGKINHPNYYQGKSFEAIDFIDAHCLNFNLGNVIKYITRAGKKDGEDSLTALRKALWYHQREINHQEAQHE